jgi:tetratricopeptide (TPR) repeat protein
MRAILAALAVVAVIAPQGATSARSLDEARRVCLDIDHNDPAFDEACTLVIEAPGASPRERAAALNNRAIMSRDVGRALRDFDQAITLAPCIAKLLNNRGLALLPDDPVRALADFDSAIRLDPLYAVAWTNRGTALSTLKRYDEAIAAYSEAIRLAPRYISPVYNPYHERALAKEAKGDRAGAARDRALMAPLFEAASRGAPDLAGPHASGLRAWEPFIQRSDVPAP